jgi:3-hydroxyisobutyrate dehydrogenase
MSNVAFIGLGVMGYPMAGYISKAGHNVTVYNRTAAKADKWVAEFKGSKADTPAKAADGADFIFTCVGNDKQLKKVQFTLITQRHLQQLLERFTLIH